MEDTTTLGVSQATGSESNQQPSLNPTAERSSEPNRMSQTSLCNICAHGLRLDDGCTSGALEAPCNDDVPDICFPFMDTASYRWDCFGGVQYEQRHVTPPHLPELSDECKFCLAVKSVILDRLGQREWWQTATTKLVVDVQYIWTRRKTEGRHANFGLFALKLEVNCHQYEVTLHVRFPIASSLGPCQEWLHITGRLLDVESPFSKRNVNMIRNWLEQCNTDPNCCRSAKQEGFLPTRLLDVGAQGSNDLPIALVDTRSMAQLRHENRPLKYICLSYCWGAAQPPLRTTEDTIESHRARIPMNSMPRVFRDAVLVTRTLGIRYLWIDALCIIQDCHGDWHNESAAMADVFSNSWITIGAAATSSCHETLFHPRQHDSIDIEFQSSINRNITGMISILPLPEHLMSPLSASLDNSTWNTRGWVWQEQKLPQRLLIFGEKMLHLRCHDRMLHEYGTYNTGVSYNPYTVSLDGLDEWRSVMKLYSHRNLSKGSDRLAAISGIVKAVAQKLENPGKSATYIAGVWLAEDAHVDWQLFWVLENPTISFEQLLRYHKDPQKYIAPSWSWAALNQPVNTLTNGTTMEFKVVTHNIKPARSDATVAVAPGSSITLLGQLRKVPGRPSMGIKSLHSGGRKRQTWWKAPYSGDESTWRRRKARERRVDRSIKYFLDWDPSTHDSDEGDVEAHLVLFLLTTCYQGDGRSAIGLILCPDVEDPNLFLRVGCFEIYGPWKSPDWEEAEVIVI